MLNKLTICDLSTRLPGPLATMALAHLGAKVLKVENTDRETDPFSSQDIKAIAPNFHDWYRNLNADKIIHQISFDKELSKLKILLESADIILMPASKTLKNLIEPLIDKSVPKVLIFIAGSNGAHKAMHDINALAMTESFRFYLEHEKKPQMPYLPFAGISFGQQIATLSLAAFIKSTQEKVTVNETIYLDQSIKKIFDALYSNKSIHHGHFLHNGAFPCYQVYKTKDNHYISLAAVEEKYWENLIKNFNLPLTIEERFDTTGKIKTLLENTFKQQNLEQILNKCVNSECCLSPCTN